MTPNNASTLFEIENECAEKVKACSSPRYDLVVTTKSNKSKPKVTLRSSWFGGFAERLAMSFVCCAPPHSLLDDDEIQEILDLIEAPSELVNSPTLSHPDLVAAPPLHHNTHALDRSRSRDIDMLMVSTSTAEVPRSRASLAAMQRVVLTLLAVYKAVEVRRAERAARAVQMQWRRVHQTASTTSGSQRTRARLATPAAPLTATAEPDREPTPVDIRGAIAVHTQLTNETRPCYSTSEPPSTPDSVHQEIVHDTIHSVQPLRARKRSLNLLSPCPRADIEIDTGYGVVDSPEDGDAVDEDDEEILELERTSEASEPITCFTLQRCASVPPPATASRPKAAKSAWLLGSQAALVIQRAWRNMKTRRSWELRRLLEQYETEKESVMPTIRSKMFELRKRLEELKERNSNVVAVPATVVAPADDDFDWL